MIKITNGSQHLEVTKGAFETMYAPFGYVVEGTEQDVHVTEVAEDNISGAEGETPAEGTEPPAGETGDVPPTAPAENEEDEEEEIPLSEMSLEKLKAVAVKLGIPANGLRSKKEAIDAINAAK